MMQRKTAAFTLIEILVVLLIISLIISAVSLYAFNTSTLQAKQTAKLIDALLGFTQQRAILEPAVFSFQLTDRGYTFRRYRIKNNSSQGDWVTIKDDPFLHNYTIPAKISVQLIPLNSNQKLLPNQQQNDENNSSPMIIFFNSGDFTPFVINVGVLQKPPVYKIIGSENGEIRLVNLQLK